jgi:hypothetical protein
LSVKSPELRAEWDNAKNTCSFDEAFCGSKEKVWWICAKNHKHCWLAAIDKRVKGAGCHFCAGKKVLPEESFAAHFPELLKEWDYECNQIQPTEITRRSSKMFWWICARNAEHKWSAKPDDRADGHGCPFCAGKKINHTNSLAALYPKLLAEWDYEKNTLVPTEIAPNTHRYVWWKCITEPRHFWQTSPNSRINMEVGCPYCDGKLVDETNCLATTHPALLLGWDYEKNIILPTEITAGTSKKVWWVCEYKHSWNAPPNDRKGGHGCPHCFGRVSKAETDWLNSLGIPNDSKHRQVKIKLGKKYLTVDGLNPTTKTVYEYLGDYWHGNPAKFDPTGINTISKLSYGELYARTLQREKSLKDAGYTVVSIWESEWKQINTEE